MVDSTKEENVSNATATRADLMANHGDGAQGLVAIFFARVSGTITIQENLVADIEYRL